MSRKVTHAALHKSSNHVPSVGEIGHTFPSNTKTLDGLEMSVSDLGLHIKYTYKGAKIENLFPLAAVSIMTLAAEVKK